MPEHPQPPLLNEEDLTGKVVIVVRPSGVAGQPAADAYGPHDEMAAHDLATLAVSTGRAAYLLDLETQIGERYLGDDL